MHWSGWIRIVAIVVGVVTLFILQRGLDAQWYVSLPLAALAYLATPVLIGLVWGLHERREREVGLALASKLLAIRGSWYSKFQQEAMAKGVRIPSNIGGHTMHYASLLQLSAAAATLQENRYVRDVSHVLELSYSILTHKPPADLHKDIDALPFAHAGDPQKSLNLWAHSVAPELAPSSDKSALLEELVRQGALLVVATKIATCETCGDSKGAKKIENFFAT